VDHIIHFDRDFLAGGPFLYRLAVDLHREHLLFEFGLLPFEQNPVIQVEFILQLDHRHADPVEIMGNFADELVFHSAPRF
jgi:hypothetical protein